MYSDEFNPEIIEQHKKSLILDKNGDNYIIKQKYDVGFKIKRKKSDESTD